MSDTGATKNAAPRGMRLLDAIERIGNALPDPASLFAIGAALVMVLSQVAVSLDWTVTKTISREVREAVLDADGHPLNDPITGETFTRALLDPTTGQVQRELATESIEIGRAHV